MAKSIKLSDAFAQAVEQALEHFLDPQWLGEHSPLAAPYFLGDMLTEAFDPSSPSARGQVLKRLLQAAALRLSAEQIELLNVTFFTRDPALNNTGVALRLDKTESTYYRHRAAAIEALAEVLNQTVRPPMHLAPPRASYIVGRETVLASCQEHLRAGRSVAITGRSGIGKTSLGLAIAADWGLDQTFWFTVRPGLNDNLSSFAFALAYFLRGQDTPHPTHAWRQLMADRGDIAPDRVLSLLKFDLTARNQTQPVMLCIDDSDQLRSETRAHVQVIHLIEELSKITPTLLLSQQSLIESDVEIVLKGLTAAETHALLEHRQVTDLNASQLHALHSVTRGLPLQIKLFADLRHTGETTAELLHYLDGERSAEGLFGRIWKKLNNAERSLLMALAVFQSPTPASAWTSAPDTLQQLVARELVLLGQHDTVHIASQIQPFVERRISSDLKPALHAHAAELHESLSEYTAAAFHLVQAGQYAQAIWLWWNHRELERGRGNMPTARDIFYEIKQSDLAEEDDRRALALLRAEQSLRVGLADEAEADLNVFIWPSQHALTPTAQRLMGDALQMQGRVEPAVLQYQAALTALADSRHRKIGQLHTQIGYIYISRLRNLERARQEALLALHQAHNFYGSVEEEAGNYVLAQAQYDAAMQIGAALPNREHVQAVTHSNLGHLLIRKGEPRVAIEHLKLALQNAREVGETINALYDQLNLISAYVSASQPELALLEANDALALAESVKNSFLIAGIATNAGKACVDLKRWDDAEQFIQRALREEEEVHRPYALVVLGWVQQHRGNLDQASRIFREAVAGAQDTQDKLSEAVALSALGDVLREQKQNTEANAAFARALNLYEALALVHEVEALRSRLSQQ